MYKFYINLAGINIEMHSKYEYAKQFCRDYLIVAPRTVDIVAEVSPEAVAKGTETKDGVISEQESEVYCLYRVIAERLPEFGCFVFHGAAISYKGKGYLFTAPSGTGKTTHICLWKRLLGDDVGIINGDKPIIKIENGFVSVCSAPWAGKERWQRNVSMPLGGICIINRGTDNACLRRNPNEILHEIMHQLYLPKNPICVGLTLALLDRMTEIVPIYTHFCDISLQAAAASVEAMTGVRKEI